MPWWAVLALILTVTHGVSGLDHSIITATGTVLSQGSEPMIYLALKTKDQGQFVLAGDLTSELRNLRGATVKVSGREVKHFGPQGDTAIYVKRYEVELIGDGPSAAKPWVGRLQVRKGHVALKTEEGHIVELAGPLVTDLGAQAGAKVWVLGNRTDSSGGALVHVTAYQVIRPRVNT